MTSNWQRLFLAPYDPDPHTPGGRYRYRGPTGIPQDLDWESLDRLCPVMPLPARYSFLTPEVIAEARAELKRGVTPPFFDQPTIELGYLFRDMARAQFPEPTSGKAGRLYVLEFQGPFQYALLGRSRNAPERLSSHILDAGRHGYGLLNAWVSPVLPRAHVQERMALDLAGQLHDANHEGERFYDMPFLTALTVVRVAAEAGLLNADPDADALEPAGGRSA